MNIFKFSMIILGSVIGMGVVLAAEGPAAPIVTMTSVPQEAKVDGKPVDLKKYQAQEAQKEEGAAKTCTNRPEFDKLKAFFAAEKAKQHQAIQAIKEAMAARYKKSSKTSRALLEDPSSLFSQLAKFEKIYDGVSLAGCFIGGAGMVSGGEQKDLKKAGQKGLKEWR